MKVVDDNFFVKMQFSEEQIQKYFLSAEKCLRIAQSIPVPEVVFKFSYDALIKFGITLIAFTGLKVKSRMGHHIKILEKTGRILKDNDVEIIGNMMRNKRNFDLYDAGTIISKKESMEFLKFVEKVYREVKGKINSTDLHD
ncbi:MAG: hypothetical protein WC651_02710 [Candidatus Gracilibacteria bacterium]|jgi:hypothetical protein